MADSSAEEELPFTFSVPLFRFSSASFPPSTTSSRGLAAMGGFLPNEGGHADERTVPGAAERHRMRVAPSQQRRGDGRVLLGRLERGVAERGYEVLLATTSQSQPAAVTFYRDRGYQAVDRSTHGECELVHFEKRL